jgi:hypothetical protein
MPDWIALSPLEAKELKSVKSPFFGAELPGLGID